jgi:hypothetical protein
MGVMSPMGEIQSGYIHPCIGKVFKDFRTIAGRAYGTDDFGM